MKNNKEVNEIIEEAETDVEDALHLIKQRSTSHNLCSYHCKQALEKFLKALSIYASRLQKSGKSKLKITEIDKDFDILVQIFPVLNQVREQVIELLSFRLSSLKTDFYDTHSFERGRQALLSLSLVRTVLFEIFDRAFISIEIPPPRIENTKKEESYLNTKEQTQRDSYRNYRENRGFRRREQYENERNFRTSGVKPYLCCKSCGVKIPRKAQTSRGKVPCPFCGHWLSE